MQALPVKYDKGTGKPLILLHSLTGVHTSWSFALGSIDKLSQRVIVLYLTGYSEVSKQPIEYTVRDCAEAVVAMLTIS